MRSYEGGGTGVALLPVVKAVVSKLREAPTPTQKRVITLSNARAYTASRTPKAVVRKVAVRATPIRRSLTRGSGGTAGKAGGGITGANGSRPSSSSSGAHLTSIGSYADFLKMATASVNNQLGPQLAALARAMAAAKTETSGATDALVKRGGVVNSDLNELYSRLAQGMKTNSANTATEYAGAENKAAGRYTALQGTTDANSSQGIATANNEMSRLGINDPNAVAGMTRDKQFMHDLLGTRSANLQDVLGMQASNAAAVGGMQQSGAGAQNEMLVGQNNRATSAGISGLQNALMKTLTELHGKTTDVESQRGYKIQEMLKAMQDQSYQRQQDQIQQNFMNGIQTNKLDIARSGQQFQYDQLHQQADLAKLAAATKTAAAGPTEHPTNYANAMSYLQSVYGGNASTQAGAQKLITDALDGMSRASVGNTKANQYKIFTGDIPGWDPKLAGLYADMAGTWSKQPTYSGMNMDPKILMNAILKALGK